MARIDIPNCSFCLERPAAAHWNTRVYCCGSCATDVLPALIAEAAPTSAPVSVKALPPTRTEPLTFDQFIAELPSTRYTAMTQSDIRRRYHSLGRTLVFEYLDKGVAEGVLRMERGVNNSCFYWQASGAPTTDEEVESMPRLKDFFLYRPGWIARQDLIRGVRIRAVVLDRLLAHLISEGEVEEKTGDRSTNGKSPVFYRSIPK